MKIEIDKNNLLTIFNENIPQTKEYTYNVGGYFFSDFDKWIIILHKKEWKIISLKNLGDNMNVVYYKEWNNFYNFNKNNFNKAFCMFQWFNEENSHIYSFIPWYWEQQIQKTNDILNKLNIWIQLQKTNNGCETKWNIEARLFSSHIKNLDNNTEADNVSFSNEEIINILFALTILYWKFENKKSELNSIKIHIPISLWQNQIMDDLDILIKQIKETWIFLNINKMGKNNWTIYQISCNDYELLEIFAKWYEPVEKFEKISKVIFTQEMKNKLLEFLENNNEIPADGKADVIEKIKNGTIKFLIK